MKRSEMVELITKMLKEYPKTSFTAPNFDRVYADLMLQELEEAGMLPPMIGEYDKITTQLYGRNEWESEE